MISFPEIFSILMIIIYSLATITAFIGILTTSANWSKISVCLTIGAFLGQTIVLVLGFHTFLPDGLSSGAYLQLIAWFILLCSIAARIYLKQNTPLFFATPFGLILFLASAPFMNMAVRLPESISTPFYALHIGVLFFSLGLLCLAFIAAMLFIFLEKRVKTRKKISRFWQDIPALTRLDKLNSIIVLTVFPLYTTGLITGFFFAKPVFGSAFTWDPKEIFSLCIWILLGALFHNRLIKGWKGKKPAILTIIIFCLSLFSVIVINYFIPTHHAFIRN